MKPDITRQQESFVSEEWGELGFQGKDPSTDFRGMGMLAANQLLFFSEKRQTTAIRILTESMHPVRYFPFAVVGINISKFIMDLLEETRLHAYIFAHLDKIYLNESFSLEHGPSANARIVHRIIFEHINDIYCDVFELFIAKWIQKDPKNGVMAFPKLFEEIKVSFRGIMKKVHEY